MNKVAKRTTSLLGGVIIAGMALLLTSCSQMNSAASIGSTQITLDTVQKSVDSVLAERAKVDTSGMTLDTGDALNRNQLRFHLISLLLADVAAQEGITVSTAEIQKEQATVITQVGGAAALPKALVNASIAPADLDLYLHSVLYSQKLTAKVIADGATQANSGTALQAIVVKFAKKAGVKVNPRYGKWDPVQANIVATDNTNGAVQ
jgi:hypothetical protein